MNQVICEAVLLHTVEIKLFDFGLAVKCNHVQYSPSWAGRGGPR